METNSMLVLEKKMNKNIKSSKNVHKIAMRYGILEKNRNTIIYVFEHFL